MGGADRWLNGASGSAARAASDTVIQRATDRSFSDIPAPPPDLTSEIIRAAMRAEADRLRVGRTRASTFMAANRSILGG